jgi:hypothetical protein
MAWSVMACRVEVLKAARCQFDAAPFAIPADTFDTSRWRYSEINLE